MQAPFTLSQIAPAQPIDGWHDFQDEGDGYLQTATKAYETRRKVFTPEILYNVIAMSIEKFVMAALMRHGALPYNHTMADLVEAMDETFPGAIAEIREGLLALDKFQEICDIDAFNIVPPDRTQIPAMLDLAAKLQQLVATELTPEK